MKAIETVFDNYRFRSRIEARWAVFYKALGIPYSYEQEGYDLDGVWYLPDFYLPEQDCFVEIKGAEPTEMECGKASALANASGKYVYMFIGEIKVPDWNTYPNTADRYYRQNNEGWEPGEPRDPGVGFGFSWCECPFCRKLEITFEGNALKTSCGCLRTHMPDLLKNFGPLMKVLPGEQNALGVTKHSQHFRERQLHLAYSESTPRLTDAYLAARQARFEHEERRR